MGFSLGKVVGSVLGSVAGSAVSGLFGSSQAEKNRDYQAYMSNTSHQREVEDLKAAGLNPMLSAKLGGASTPPGAQASMPAFENPVAAAIGLQKTQAEIANAKQLTSESRAREKLTENQSQIASANAVIDNVRAARELAEYTAVDSTPAGKSIGPMIQSLPSWLRGAVRTGIGAYDKLSNIQWQDIAPPASAKEQEHQSKSDAALSPSKLKELLKRIQPIANVYREDPPKTKSERSKESINKAVENVLKQIDY